MSPEGKEARKLRRKPEATDEVLDLRHAEMQTISQRLGRVCEVPRAPRWEKASELSYGACLGGAVGFVPFIASDPAAILVEAYVVLVAIAGVLGFVFHRAAGAISGERVEQIGAIKQDYDKFILKTFVEPEDGDQRIGR